MSEMMGRTTRKRKGGVVVGYLNGYKLRRAIPPCSHNPNFHEDAGEFVDRYNIPKGEAQLPLLMLHFTPSLHSTSLDEVNQELQDFTFSLYNSRGQCCRAPRGSGIVEIMAMDGSILLIEMMEQAHLYWAVELWGGTGHQH